MKHYILILLAFLNVACGNFLEEYSQDLAYAKTVSDLEEVLLGDGYVNKATTYPWLHTMDDDLEESVLNAENSTRRKYDNYFTWASYPSSLDNEVIKDQTWVDMYKSISTTNVILSKLKNIETNVPEDAERLEGECYFLRGYLYWFLANIYAKPYVTQSAETDLGVPIKTTEYIEDEYFSRNTLAETYELILSDLQTAAKLLKGKEHQSVMQADYYAVQALLSRIYLYVGNYEAALAAADSVLQGPYSLLDYNTLPQDMTGYGDISPVSVIYLDSPETIFTQGGNVFSGNKHYTGLSAGTTLSRVNIYKASEELQILYDKEVSYGNDLRKTFYMYYMFDNQQKCYIQKIVATSDKVASSEFLLGLPEVLLNKAEALVMLGRDAEAQNTLEELRAKRIDADTYQALEQRTGNHLVELIREERRRELVGSGQRWFDLRRYAVHPLYPFSKEIIHDHYNYDQSTQEVVYVGSYKLEKYENEPAYVIPIPQHAIEYNNGHLVDNAPRPTKESFIR